MIFHNDMVIDLFSPTQCDDNDHEDHHDNEVVNDNNENENGIDEILRQDFSNYLQESLPGTYVTFKVDDVKKVYDVSTNSNVIGLSGTTTTESLIEKYAVLYVDFYPRTISSTTKPVTMSSTNTNKKIMAQKTKENELCKKQQTNQKLLVPDELSIGQQQQQQQVNTNFDNNNNNGEEYDDDDIVVRNAAKKMAEIIGSISDTSISDNDDNTKKDNTENDEKNITDSSANGMPEKNRNMYEYCQNTPIKNNMSCNSDSDTNLNNIKTSLKYSYFKQMSIHHSPKNSDMDDSDIEIKEQQQKQLVEDNANATPKKKSSAASANALKKLPPPPTPVSPTNVADVSMIHSNSTTNSQSTTETKNTVTNNVVTKEITNKDNNKNKDNVQPQQQEENDVDDDTQDEIIVEEDDDNKTSITNLWMVENEENFDILEWYQNLWDMKSITSITSNNNKNKDTTQNETTTNENNFFGGNDGQSFIGPIFSFASDDGDIASVLTGTIMSHQETLEYNVLASFEKISNKKENITCFGASTCIPMKYDEDDDTGENKNWFCNSVLEPTMEFTMQLCDLNYDGKKIDDTKNKNDTSATTTPIDPTSSIPCDVTDNNSILMKDNDI